MRTVRHILLFLAGALALAGCRDSHLIPRSEMADIYYDLFLTDQVVRESSDLRSRADTTLVYEAVFNRYGYDTDDFQYSVRYYLRDPERFAKILHEVNGRLQADAVALEPLINYLEWADEFMKMPRPPIDSVMAPFSRDSLYLGVARVTRDSVSAAWFRLEGAGADTLMVPIREEGKDE